MAGEAGLLTYLTDAPDPRPEEGALCVGDPVVLRQSRRGRTLEAWSPAGRRLGALPPAESEALSEMLTEHPHRLRGHIAALVPRPRVTGPGRIHIRVLEQD